MAMTTMGRRRSDGDGQSAMCRMLTSPVPPIQGNNQLMLIVWGGVDEREGRFWGTGGQKRVEVEAIGWRSLHLHSINSKSTSRTPQSGKRMESYSACVLGVRLAIGAMASMFNPLVPRPPAGLPLVLSSPHKKHTNTNKRGNPKGERQVSA
jgi:hypothetical protein